MIFLIGILYITQETNPQEFLEILMLMPGNYKKCQDTCLSSGAASLLTFDRAFLQSKNARSNVNS